MNTNHNEKTECLPQIIYDTICYECEIDESKFSPEILINYRKHEQLGLWAKKNAQDIDPDHFLINKQY